MKSLKGYTEGFLPGIPLESLSKYAYRLVKAIG